MDDAVSWLMERVGAALYQGDVEGALELVERRVGELQSNAPGSLELAETTRMLPSLYLRCERYDDSKRSADDALALAERLGVAENALVSFLFTAGQAHVHPEVTDRGVTLLSRAAELAERSQSPNLGPVLHALATVAQSGEDWPVAISLLNRMVVVAKELGEASSGNEEALAVADGWTTVALRELAFAHAQLGQWIKAAEFYEAALRFLTASHDPNHPDVVEVRGSLADARRRCQ